MLAGQSVRCPACGEATRKDDACMHMRCRCGTAFCYVCGTPNPGAGLWDCGCDDRGSGIEQQPGWGGFARGERGETPARGALAEFHRRRAARLLRVVAEAVGAEAWAALRARHPGLLGDVVEGRGVAWEEVAGAEHPQFGSGRARWSWAGLEESLRRRWRRPDPGGAASG